MKVGIECVEMLKKEKGCSEILQGVNMRQTRAHVLPHPACVLETCTRKQEEVN